VTTCFDTEAKLDIQILQSHQKCTYFGYEVYDYMEGSGLSLILCDFVSRNQNCHCDEIVNFVVRIMSCLVHNKASL